MLTDIDLDSLPKFVAPAQGAELAGRSPRTLYTWMGPGVHLPDGTTVTLPSMRIGGRRLIAVVDLIEFIKKISEAWDLSHGSSANHGVLVEAQEQPSE